MQLWGTMSGEVADRLQHDTVWHGTAQPGTARHGTARWGALRGKAAAFCAHRPSAAEASVRYEMSLFQTCPSRAHSPFNSLSLGHAKGCSPVCPPDRSRQRCERCMMVLSLHVSNFWLIKLPFGPRLTIRPTLSTGPCPVSQRHKVIESCSCCCSSSCRTERSKQTDGQTFLIFPWQLTANCSYCLRAAATLSLTASAGCLGKAVPAKSSQSIPGGPGPSASGSCRWAELQEATAGTWRSDPMHKRRVLAAR